MRVTSRPLPKGTWDFQEVILTGLSHVTMTHLQAAQGYSAGGLRGGQSPVYNNCHHQTLPRPGGHRAQHRATLGLPEPEAGLFSLPSVWAAWRSSLQAKTGCGRPHGQSPSSLPRLCLTPFLHLQSQLVTCLLTGVLSPGYRAASPGEL